MIEIDPELSQPIQRLHKLTVYGRWLFVLICWLSFGIFGIWGLRGEISLWSEYFTWSAVRYGLAYNRLPAFCLSFCIAITASVLVWQSRNIIKGLPDREIYRLQQEVLRIKAIGSKHPLWKWLFKN